MTVQPSINYEVGTSFLAGEARTRWLITTSNPCLVWISDRNGVTISKLCSSSASRLGCAALSPSSRILDSLLQRISMAESERQSVSYFSLVGQPAKSCLAWWHLSSKRLPTSSNARCQSPEWLLGLPWATPTAFANAAWAWFRTSRYLIWSRSAES